MANERLFFLACNIFTILLYIAFIAVHSGERCGPWASVFLFFFVFFFTSNWALTFYLANAEMAKTTIIFEKKRKI